MAGDEGIVEGLYESLITRELERRIAATPGLDFGEGAIADADEPEIFSRHLRDAVKRALVAERQPARRLELMNQLLSALGDDQAGVVKASQLLSAAPPLRRGTRHTTSVDRRLPCPTPHC